MKCLFYQHHYSSYSKSTGLCSSSLTLDGLRLMHFHAEKAVLRIFWGWVLLPLYILNMTEVWVIVPMVKSSRNRARPKNRSGLTIWDWLGSFVDVWKISSYPLLRGQTVLNAFSVPLSAAHTAPRVCFRCQARWEAAQTKLPGANTRARRGCQAHGANLGRPRVNTESRHNHLQAEASSDVKGDQVLIKLPEPGSQRGFVLNLDRA